jgi:Glycogen debranching enzyme
MDSLSKWIGCEQNNVTDSMLLYFRRKFHVGVENAALQIKVSADSRYKLYVNENLVSIGPCKGNENTWYYEMADVSKYLVLGENIISAEVVHYPDITIGRYEQKGPFSVARTSSAAFWLEGSLQNSDQELLEDISTDEKWRCMQEKGIVFLPPVTAYLSGGFEHFMCNKITFGWKRAEFDDSAWPEAKVITNAYFDHHSANSYGELTPWNLTARPIPQMYRKEKLFTKITKTDQSSGILPEFIQGEKSIRFSAGSTFSMDVTAGELTTGYLKLCFTGGTGSKIKIIYSEAYEQNTEGAYTKGIRDDNSGIIRGNYDLIEPDGKEINHETFWFRTFRFIRIEINTGADALTIKNLSYIETGYPLAISGEYESSEGAHRKLWDISLRTLLRCMHETYEDCPYYEQLQYAMDSRLEMLFTYQLSRDDRLARKCIQDFHSSLLPNGLLQSRYPCIVKQIIPGFCLQFIFMLEDHFMYFGDLEFIKQYRPTMDAVLSWFDRNIQKQGLVDKTGYWSFVDWVEGWEMNSVPKANQTGPTTIYNLMYAKALQSAAFLNEATGREGMEKEYLDRSRNILEAVRTYCYDEERHLFKDGPEVKEYSQHCQVWAILCGAVNGSDAKELMKRALECNISKVSYAMSFYLFRALEKTGLYEYVLPLFETWRHLADLNLTTWVEDPVRQRSDCHAWGSVPLYEFSAMILGVRPITAGYTIIQIKPFIGTLRFAKGTVMTKFGKVQVEWNISGNEFTLQINSPEKMEKEIIMPDGSRHISTDASIILSSLL